MIRSNSTAYQEKESFTPSNPADISEKHRAMLCEESGIDLQILKMRGYFTARNRTQLTDLPKYARRYTPALVMPMYSPDGETVSYQTRPDKAPTLNGKKSKYLSVKPTVIDVHPIYREEVHYGLSDLWITEGVKKGDALASRGLTAVTLAGVWMFAEKDSGGKKLLPCWDHVQLEGRTVNVVYDSDVMSKESVQAALSRLVAALEERGATVKVVYLPDAENGDKQGVDDWFAAGGTVEELQKMPQDFEPRTVTDSRVRDALNAAWRAYDQMPYRTMRDNSKRAVLRDLLQSAERNGKIKAGKLVVRRSRSGTALAASMSERTVSKIYVALEAEGYIHRPDEPDRPEGVPTAFEIIVGGRALRSPPNRGRGREEKEAPLEQPCDRGENAMRALPELRWSALRIGYENGERVYDFVARLGKKRREIVAYLIQYGPVTVGGLMEVFAGKSTRPRDFVDRTLGPMLDPAVVSLESGACAVDTVVSLTPDYLDAVERHRELGDEIEAREKQEQAIKERREAYRNRHNIQIDESPTEAEMDERKAALFEERKRRAVEAFAAAKKGPQINLRNYLDPDVSMDESYLTTSVLQHLGEPWHLADDWHEAVLEAAEDQRDESRDGPSLRRAPGVVIDASHRFKKGAA